MYAIVLASRVASDAGVKPEDCEVSRNPIDIAPGHTHPHREALRGIIDNAFLAAAEGDPVKAEELRHDVLCWLMRHGEHFLDLRGEWPVEDREA
jgi:hypothetical protein